MKCLFGRIFVLLGKYSVEETEDVKEIDIDRTDPCPQIILGYLRNAVFGWLLVSSLLKAWLRLNPICRAYDLLRESGQHELSHLSLHGELNY